MGLYKNNNGTLTLVAGSGNLDEVYSAMAFNGVKNLARLQYDDNYSTSMGSITHTYNDGEVTLSAGTASAQSYSIPAISTAGFELEADRDYVLTGVPSNAPEGVSLRLRYNNGSNVTVATDEGEGASFTFTSAMKNASNGYNLMINVASGTVIPAGGIVIRPMIRYAEDKGTAFEKHTSNNRELDSEKFSYKANTVLGAKNLLPNDASTTTINNVLYTVNSDGTINVSRTDTQTQISTMYIASITEDKYKTFAGKTLFMSGCPEGGSNDTYYLECYYNDGTEHWLRDTGNGLIIKFPATKPSVIRFLVGVKVATVTLPTDAFKPMLTLMDYKDSEYTPHSMTNAELTQSVNDLKFSISQSVTLSTSAATTVTFTSAKITANSIVDLGFSEWGIFPDDVVCASGTCTVTLPQVESAKTITVTLFLK